MDATGIANDKNIDGLPSCRDMQYLAPPGQHQIVVTAPEQEPPNVNDSHGRHLPRNYSSGTIQELQTHHHHHHHQQMSRRGSSTDLSISRRPSAVVAAMRRPSMPRTILMEYVHCSLIIPSLNRIEFFFSSFFCSLLSGRMLGGSKSSIRAMDEFDDDFVRMEADPEYEFRMQNRRRGDDALTTALSAFYAKLIVVLGIAFPITDILGTKAPSSFYQGFYLYLYIVSVAFVAFMHMTRLRSQNGNENNSTRAKGETWTRWEVQSIEFRFDFPRFVQTEEEGRRQLSKISVRQFLFARWCGRLWHWQYGLLWTGVRSIL